MHQDKIKAGLLVSIQFVCILLIFMTGSPLAHAPVLRGLEIAGVMLGLWAFVAMGWHNLSASPLIKKGVQLVTSGPYRLIRHPMYSAVLLTTWPLVIDQFSIFRLGVGLALALDLTVKIRYEESLLKGHFAEYADYMQKTERLIPFIL